MHPVSPVIPTDEHQEVVIAEHQEEYMNLPAIVCDGGIILCRWKLSDEEIEMIKKTGDIYLMQWTGGRLVTPILLQVEKPVFSEDSTYKDEILESEVVTAPESLTVRNVNGKPKYEIKYKFDAEKFQWGMEDGLCMGQTVIERNPEVNESAEFPGYTLEQIKWIKLHGVGYFEETFQPYIKTHRDTTIVNEDTWIVTNPAGDKEVYLSKDFYEIYQLAK